MHAARFAGIFFTSVQFIIHLAVDPECFNFTEHLLFMTIPGIYVLCIIGSFSKPRLFVFLFGIALAVEILLNYRIASCVMDYFLFVNILLGLALLAGLILVQRKVD